MKFDVMKHAQENVFELAGHFTDPYHAHVKRLEYTGLARQ
jgi:hypothetical protein